MKRAKPMAPWFRLGKHVMRTSEGEAMISLFKTDDAWSSLVLRLTLGLVMFPHGAQKLLGLYGGAGFDGTMAFFTQKMGLPGSSHFWSSSENLLAASGCWQGS
jgi:DoxX